MRRVWGQLTKCLQMDYVQLAELHVMHWVVVLSMDEQLHA